MSLLDDDEWQGYLKGTLESIRSEISSIRSLCDRFQQAIADQKVDIAKLTNNQCIQSWLIGAIMGGLIALFLKGILTF